MFSIDTPRLTARFSQERDLEAESQALFDNYTGRTAESAFLARNPHIDVSDTLILLLNWSCARSWVHNNRAALIIEEKSSQQPIGQLVLFRNCRQLEFHFGISYDHAGQGLATELIQGLVNWAASQPYIDELISYCDVNHIASQRVMAKSGFKQTGRLARHYTNPNQGGREVDCFSYCLQVPL
ncbi:GNAT family N-acetyltransferase [Endozoicomonadaceae bacterium StTr2]